ncbi:PPRC1: Peroxisome proliferator-activated receptor gamma coactivator-related protein 1 [Crotalus adamanteus]|uniref:PPRC1: Peroxisome proliferator-activated receptor gamma coactivator-related protein 1 n=1 Tax=Crotalus adamanteus TaxID=8729 RepID=A0AAW1BGG1_CROAD
MAALWGGGAGHAGAGGTLPMRGASEPLVGNSFSSTQCLLAEDLRLASLEAETILEAGEFLETMQDYLDSSVISIIEDFSSLTEVKSHMDAENELSLLTAITDILDSTDDETLSPFDPIPESELLTSPREIENSSVEASTPGIPFSLSSSCPKLSFFSNNVSNKAFWEEQKLFKNREQESPVLQSSDGEEEEKEVTRGCRESFTAVVKEMEPERDLDECDDPYIIAAENISLDELVRSVHSYCQPTLTVCLTSDNQSLTEKNLTGPLVLEIMPDGGEIMMGKELPELDSYKQDGKVVNAILPNIKDGHLQIEDTQKSTDNQNNTPVPASVAPKNASKKDQVSTNIKKKKRKKSREEAKYHKTINCQQVSACPQMRTRIDAKKSMTDSSFQKKELEKTGRKKLLLNQVSQTKEMLETQVECVREEGSKNPLLSSLVSARNVPYAEELTQNLGNADLVPIVQTDVPGEPHEKSQFLLPMIEISSSEPSQMLPGCTTDLTGQPTKDTPSCENQKLICPPRETKPRPLSLSEYRQRRQQRPSNNDGIQNTRENRSASKWPSVPNFPTELADLPCLRALPPTKAAPPKLAKEPEKLAAFPTTLAPDDKASAVTLSMLSSATTMKQRDPPSSQNVCGGSQSPTSQLPSPTPIAVVPASKVCAFSHIGPQVPPALSVPHVPPARDTFLSAPPNHYNLGSSQPAGSSWSHFALLPANYQSLPPPPPLTEACSPVFHTVPPLLPPTWPPPPVPLPFVPALPYGSVEWAPLPQSSYWSGIPVPPPVLPIPYGDQGSLRQSPQVGTLPASSLSDGFPGQQSTALAPESSCTGFKNMVSESQSLPVQICQVEAPSAIRAAPRKIYDPRRQTQLSTVQSQTEIISNTSQSLEKLPLSPSVDEPSKEIASTQHRSKSSALQSLGVPLPVPPSHQILGESAGKLKLSKEDFQSIEKNPELSDFVETTTVTVAQNNKKPPAEEHSFLSVSLAPGKQKEPAEIQSDVTEHALVAPNPLTLSGPQKVQKNGHLSKKTSSSMWKNQPFINSVQHKHDKDLVHSFINEIGIEASDLSSLLEQFEKIEGLTPPATPPHQLWKPLIPVSLLGQDGSQKDTRLLKSLNKFHWKAVTPVHVGSGEHDYCQLTVAQPKGGARWNVKQNLDITIKPIKTLTRQVLDQTSADIKRPPAAVRLNPVVPTCQNPGEFANHVNSNKGQTKDSRTVMADLKPTMPSSALLETSHIHPCKEALDHRTTIPRSMNGGNDDPCSVLLSPAASPCRDSGESSLQQLQEIQEKPLASKSSLRCYRSRQRSASPESHRGRSRRNHASRSFSSSSDGDSDTSSSSSSSSSQSRSRSPPSKHWRSYNSSSSYERYQRQKNKYKERAIEERRVVFIGKIHNGMTRSELRHRFSVFGDIEDCTLHFREHGDNFGFVTYRYAEDAFAAIEGGHALLRPDEQPFDLGFGGRRQFCKRSYADLDSSQDDFQPALLKNKYDALDFDTLLKQAQRSLRR